MRQNQDRGTELRRLLDGTFVVSGEMIENNGEDCYVAYVGKKYGITGVFDGCGGIGARKYESYGNKTGAYIASHLSAETILTWFYEFSQSGLILSKNSINDMCCDIKESLVDTLAGLDLSKEKSLIKGSLVKKFPTTASFILFYIKEKKLYTAFIWAGDSRGYILRPNGLTQITKDDIVGGEDALLNLSADGKLNNVISADGDFHLSSKLITCGGPVILITATDGCFGYYSSPMEFEYMLLDTMLKSRSISAWKENIGKSIKEYTGDDFTISFVIYGFGGFKELKKAFNPRKTKLHKEVICKLKNNDMIESLWNEYKKGYYGGEKQ